MQHLHTGITSGAGSLAAPKQRVVWLWHGVTWIVFYVIVTTAVYWDPQMQALERSWIRIFAENSAFPLRMMALSIGVWALTGWVWQSTYSWMQRAVWYVSASMVWVAISITFKYVVQSLAGTASTVGLEGYVLWAYVLFWGAAACAAMVFFYQQYRHRETEALLLMLENTQLEAQVTQMQLQTLRAQLKPHFLFNVHNALAGLVRKGDRTMALKMLTALSDLLRKTLAHDQAALIPLREEIAFIQHYLDLEQIRFQERLHITIAIEKGAQEVMVPTMILQPLVENAIRHGIAEVLEGGRVIIEAAYDTACLNVSVYNDGPLLPVDWRLGHQVGIGLRNTRERLQKQYGEDGLFEVSNVEDTGVVVTLRIPIYDTVTHVVSSKQVIDA